MSINLKSLTAFILLIVFGCSKSDNKNSPNGTSLLSADYWTKAAGMRFDRDADAIDYIVTDKDKGILYMDNSFYYYLDSNFNLLNKYSFSFINIPYNNFINQNVFWNQIYTDINQADQRISYLQFVCDKSETKINYYSQRDIFPDTTANVYYYFKSILQNSNYNVGCVQINHNKQTYYKIFTTDLYSLGTAIYNYVQLPDSSVELYTAVQLNNQTLYIIGQHCYTKTFGGVKQVNDIPTGYKYKWSYNSKAYFTNGKSLLETSDGINFNETIQGLKIYSLYKPSPNGFAMAYNQQDSLYLINLNNNTKVNIDRSGLVGYGNVKGGMLTNDNKLILFKDDKLYVKLLK